MVNNQELFLMVNNSTVHVYFFHCFVVLLVVFLQRLFQTFCLQHLFFILTTFVRFFYNILLLIVSVVCVALCCCFLFTEIFKQQLTVCFCCYYGYSCGVYCCRCRGCWWCYADLGFILALTACSSIYRWPCLWEEFDMFA